MAVALAQGLGRFLFGRDVAAGDIDEAFVGGHGPGDPAPAAVAVTQTVFDAHGRHALCEPRADGVRRRRIVGMAQFAHMQRLELVLAPAEQTGPGRVDAEEVAIEIADAEQILGYLPDPVAFARALLISLSSRSVRTRSVFSLRTRSVVSKAVTGHRRCRSERSGPESGCS